MGAVAEAALGCAKQNSRVSQWRNIPASGELGVLRGSISSMNRVSCVPLPAGRSPTLELFLPMEPPPLPETEVARHLYAERLTLDHEDPTRTVFLPLRIKAHPVLLDLRSNAKPYG